MNLGPTSCQISTRTTTQNLIVIIEGQPLFKFDHLKSLEAGIVLPVYSKEDVNIEFVGELKNLHKIELKNKASQHRNIVYLLSESRAHNQSQNRVSRYMGIYYTYPNIEIEDISILLFICMRSSTNSYECDHGSYTERVSNSHFSRFPFHIDFNFGDHDTIIFELIIREYINGVPRHDSTVMISLVLSHPFLKKNTWDVCKNKHCFQFFPATNYESDYELIASLFSNKVESNIDLCHSVEDYYCTNITRLESNNFDKLPLTIIKSFPHLLIPYDGKYLPVGVRKPLNSVSKLFMQLSLKPDHKILKELYVETLIETETKRKWKTQQEKKQIECPELPRTNKIKTLKIIAIVFGGISLIAATIMGLLFYKYRLLSKQLKDMTDLFVMTS
ncbi:hypothetical protein HZS_6069 [Henneguya salminicola]|nr:hypothetical protein HZS_6069 [Henneguya salminicola]